MARVLGPDGLLPPGRHVVTTDQLRTVFVDGFPDSATRRRLFARWERHREALASVLPVDRQWIDGSFVTGTESPRDIDVVTFLDGPAFDLLSPGLQDMVASLVSGKRTKAIWTIDSYPVFRYPDDDPRSSDARTAADEWDWLWSRVRGDDSGVKGYLEVGA